MPKFIENNPFRVLGVYSNASLKELTANKTRIAAFAKVSKTVSFPLDGISKLPEVIRTTDTVTLADHELSLPQSKLTHALFWFVNGTSIDEVAIGHYMNGDAEKAKELLEKKETPTSLVNLAVINLIEGHLGNAMTNICTLVRTPEMCSFFVSMICGDTFTIQPIDLWKSYVDVLLQETHARALFLWSNKMGGDEQAYIRKLAGDQTIKDLNIAIDNAKNKSKSSAPSAAYAAGSDLMEIAKRHLPFLKVLLYSDTIRYNSIVDALASQILQSGIYYYNDSSDEDKIEKAIILQEYATSIATPGSLVYQRCKKNLDILFKNREQLPPARVRVYDSLIKERLNKYSSLKRKTIVEIMQLLKDCIHYLTSIQHEVSGSNYLVEISTMIANIALSDTIDNVNAQIEFREKLKSFDLMKHLDQSISSPGLFDDDDNEFLGRYSLRINSDPFMEAKEVFHAIFELTTSLEFRKNRFEPNAKILFNGSYSHRTTILTDKKSEKELVESCKTVADCEEYRRLFPRGLYGDMFAAKVEFCEYNSCKTVEDCKKFHAKYPKTTYSVASKIEECIYLQCMSVESLKRYIESYPSGRFVEQAKQRIHHTERWKETQASDSLELYEKFIKDFPHSSKYEEAFWYICKKKGKYKDYLEKYKRGQYSSEAEKIIENRSRIKTIAIIIFVVVAIFSAVGLIWGTDGYVGLLGFIAFISFFGVGLSRGDMGCAARIIGIIIAGICVAIINAIM